MLKKIECGWCGQEIDNPENIFKVINCGNCGSTGIPIGGHTVESISSNGSLFDESGQIVAGTSTHIARYFIWQLPKDWKSGTIECRKCGGCYDAKLSKEGPQTVFFEADGICQCHYNRYSDTVYAEIKNWKLIKGI